MTPEQIICHYLRDILLGLPQGASIPNSKQLHLACSGLEYFLPGILREIHPEWNNISLDGVAPIASRKTGPEEAEIAGYCWIIDDQTVAPIHVHFQLGETTDEITWLECRLGEIGTFRTRHYNKRQLTNRVLRLGFSVDDLDWAFEVTYGIRRRAVLRS